MDVVSDRLRRRARLLRFGTLGSWGGISVPPSGGAFTEREVDMVDEVHTSTQELRARTCVVCGRIVPEQEAFYWGTHCAQCAARSLDDASDDSENEFERPTWRRPGLE